MSDRAPYSRVYWTVMDDPKFDGVREDCRHFGAWCLLLIVADMAWPAPAFRPPTVPAASFRLLVNAGLVDTLTGGRFRIHGLDAERGRRRDAAQTGSRRVANGTQTVPVWDPNGSSRARLDETRQDKTSNRAPARERPKDELREAQRAAYIELYGNGSDEPIVTQPSPIPSPEEQEREIGRKAALALHERFLNGEIGAGEYERLRDDIGKQPDDLTRAGA